jgi:tetratricopeptide (TPR) repeat protein
VAAAPVPTPAPAAAAPAPKAELVDDQFASLEQACQQAFTKKKYKDIVDSCARALDSKPTAANVAVMLAQTEFDRGRAGQALVWAKKAVAVDPNLADAYVFIGGAEQSAGRAQAAKAAYQRYLELAPNGRYAQDLRTIVRSL